MVMAVTMPLELGCGFSHVYTQTPSASNPRVVRDARNPRDRDNLELDSHSARPLTPLELPHRVGPSVLCTEASSSGGDRA